MDTKPSNKRPTKKMVNVSKFLALVLRHKAHEFGLDIEQSGYIKLDDIINLHQAKGFHFTPEMIKELIANDQKGRYQLEDRPPLYIRAVQGHSMQSVSNDETLTKIVNIFKYPTVVHGTNSTAWGFIEKTGLNKMARNAIHFSIGYAQEGHVKSGMRISCDIFIEVNVIEAFYNDIPFYISVNNVILSPGIEGIIPVKFVKKVTQKDVGVIYAEKYIYVIHLDKNKKKAIILKEGTEVLVEENVAINDCTSLNKFGDIFINGNYAKEPFIVLIDQDFKEEYCSAIKNYIENDLMSYPGLYVDYITYTSQSSIKDYAKNLNAKEMEKVNLDWKKYYNLFESKPKEEQIKPQEANQQGYEQLSKEIIKDSSKVKHYILFYIEANEGNIELIHYSIINSSNMSDQTTNLFSFAGKSTKKGVEDFLDGLKQNISDKGILNKRLVVCIRRSDKEILVKAMTKQSIQVPKLFTRNQIILKEDAFQTIINDNFQSNFSQTFCQNYIQTDEQINALDIV